MMMMKSRVDDLMRVLEDEGVIAEVYAGRG
jgi:hypothetical protein